MDETIANNAHPKPDVKCDECDTVKDHYVTFVSPENEIKHVCWSCQQRDDKSVNRKPDWKRSPRQIDVKAANEK